MWSFGWLVLWLWGFFWYWVAWLVLKVSTFLAGWFFQMLVSPLLAGSMVYRVLGFFSRFSVCWFISFWISGPLFFTLVSSSIWFTWSRWFMWFRSSSWSCDQLLRPFIGLSGFGVSFPGFLSVSSFFFWISGSSLLTLVGSSMWLGLILGYFGLTDSSALQVD